MKKQSVFVIILLTLAVFYCWAEQPIEGEKNWITVIIAKQNQD